MTEITVTAGKEVVSVYIETLHGQPGNVQGTVATVLTTPDDMQNVIYSTTPVRRDIETADQTVKDAIATLTEAVLAWEEEDNPPDPAP